MLWFFIILFFSSLLKNFQYLHKLLLSMSLNEISPIIQCIVITNERGSKWTSMSSIMYHLHNQGMTQYETNSWFRVTGVCENTPVLPISLCDLKTTSLSHFFIHLYEINLNNNVHECCLQISKQIPRAWIIRLLRLPSVTSNLTLLSVSYCCIQLF